MAKVSVGLEIGTASVKAVELIHKRNSYRLKRLAREDIPLVKTEAEKEEAVIRAIRELVHRHKINTKRVISGIGGESVISRKIRVPSMKEGEIKQAMRWQAEEYIPYPIDQICLGFHIFDKELEKKKEKKEEMSVILVGAKRETVDERLRILHKAGISPQIMDVNAFALFNIFELSDPEEMDEIALLEIGHSTTSILLLDRGTPFLIRDIHLGGFHITQAIAEQMGVSYEKAEDMKKKYGIMISHPGAKVSKKEKKTEEVEKKKTDKELVDEAIRRSISNLVEDILHSFEYYISQREGLKIKKVVLSGGSSHLRNIDKFLSEQLEVPVETINPFSAITYSSSKFQPGYLSKVGPIFAIGLGLALRRIIKE